MSSPLYQFFSIRIPPQISKSIPLLFLFAPGIILSLLLLLTYLYTTLRFRIAARSRLRANPALSTASTSTTAAPPLPLPYTIPFLGHAFTFLQTKPGRFFEILRPSSSRSDAPSWGLPTWIQAVTLHLAGQRMHISWDPTTIAALFKDRTLARHAANVSTLHNLMGMQMADVDKFYGKDLVAKGGVKLDEEGIYHSWLLEKDAVAELTGKFLDVLKQRLFSDKERNLLTHSGSADDDGWIEIKGLYYSWLRPILFEASTVSFMGSNLFNSYPQTSGQAHDKTTDKDAFARDFFAFDSNFLSMFFGIPRFISPVGWAERDRLKCAFAAWGQKWIDATAAADPVVHSEIPWDPRFGSRFIRERQKYYDSRGLSAAARASVDLGLLFGISSNAIPATGWMLAHLVADPALRRRALAELHTATKPAREGEGDDGPPNIDPAALATLPFLNATFNETLRLYADVLVQREVTHDTVLPTTSPTAGGGGGGGVPVKFTKGSMIVVPSWMGQHDPHFAPWTAPAPVDVFCPDRFLRTEPQSAGAEKQQVVFSTAGTQGRYFPFGGGKTICPGRTFAKQEVLAGVAVVLLLYEFEDVPLQVPGIRESWPGSAVVGMKGDMTCRVRRRKRV